MMTARPPRLQSTPLRKLPKAIEKSEFARTAAAVVVVISFCPEGLLRSPLSAEGVNTQLRDREIIRTERERGGKSLGEATTTTSRERKRERENYRHRKKEGMEREGERT